jgi:deoxyribonuclease IV
MGKDKILLGAHISIAGGFHKSIERGEKIGCNTIQIFTKNSRSWLAKKITKEEADKFKQAQKKSSIQTVVAHSSYLINIGSSKPETEKKSIKALTEELDRCEQLDIPYLVLHPGAHTGAGEEACIEKIAKNLDIVLSKSKGNTMLLLEITAGQGTNIGYTFEHLKKIRQLSKEKRKMGVCFDTCHAYSAGYNFGTEKGYKKIMADFDKIIGLKKLKVIHLNDSKTELGSRKDRHANIGKGKIPLKAFQMIMNDKKLQEIPKILETPIQNENDYVDEIKLLKKMIK